VYGAEHLLRLFVKLPELLPPTGGTLGYSSNTYSWDVADFDMMVNQ
jgi:hypothetical protein